MRLWLIGVAFLAISCAGGESPFVERGNEICRELSSRSRELGPSPLVGAGQLTPEVAEAARAWAERQQRLYATALEELRRLDPPDDLAESRNRLFDEVDGLAAVGKRAAKALDESLAAQQRGDEQAEAAADGRLRAANRQALRIANRGRRVARDLGLVDCVDALFAR